MSKPLLVLDTNVVLDLLHFDDAIARPLLDALEEGRVRCAASAATLEELMRVLAYPEFGLDLTQQTALGARYRGLAEMARTVEGDEGPPHKGAPVHAGPKPVGSRVPRCSDPDDQKFIELAAAVRAQGLVSRDRAVLKLRRLCAPAFQVMTPAEAVRWLGSAMA